VVEIEKTFQNTEKTEKDEMARHGLEILLETKGLPTPIPPIVADLFVDPWNLHIDDVKFILEKLGDIVPEEVSNNALLYSKKSLTEQSMATKNEPVLKTEQKVNGDIDKKSFNDFNIIETKSSDEKNYELLLIDLYKLLIDRKAPISSVIINAYAWRRNVFGKDKARIISRLGWQKTQINEAEVDMYVKSLTNPTPEPEFQPEPITHGELPYKKPTYIKVDRVPRAHKHLRIPTEDVSTDDDYYPDSNAWLKKLGQEKVPLCETETAFLYPQPKEGARNMRRVMYRRGEKIKNSH
jgi:hypothetical protein